MKISNSPLDKKEAAQEESLLSDVLKPHQTEIAEIWEAYKLILGLLTRFKENYPSVDPQLSTYYIDLFALVERNIKTIEDTIYFKYDSPDRPGMPAYHIHTDIYKDFYKPFANLYEAQITNEKLSNWDNIQKQLNVCYAQVNEIYHKHNSEAVKNLPHEELFTEVRDYLKSKGQSLELNKNLYALRLCLRNDRLYITGTALHNGEVTLQKIRKSKSSLLLELTIKACANKPTEFRSVTKNLLSYKSGYSPKEFQEAVEDISRFKQYISNIGLKEALKECFYGNANSDLGYKFRTAVSESEWKSLSQNKQKAILKMLVNTKNEKA